MLIVDSDEEEESGNSGDSRVDEIGEDDGAIPVIHNAPI